MAHRKAIWIGVGALWLCTAMGCGSDEEESSEEPNWPPSARPELVQELRTARDAPRHPSDGQGYAQLILGEGESSSVVAGRRRDWKIRFTAGAAGIQLGGFIRLTVPRFWEWSPAQDSAPDYPGYTLARTQAEGVQLESFEARGFWMEWRIRGRALAAGESIEIHYGASPALAVADKYAERDSRFWISVDGDGDGFASLLEDSPAVDVVAGPPSRLMLVLPSTAEPGDGALLRISMLDRSANAGTSFQGEIKLEAFPEGLELPASVRLDESDKGSLRLPFIAKQAGVYRILAQAMIGDVEIIGQSNPLLVEDNVAPIRWGDLHGHSNFSDGTGTPDDFLSYARDIAGLDVDRKSVV